MWNECFDFNVAQLDGTLRVECFDQDMFIDESLGKFDVELASLRLEDGQVSRYHPLKEAAGKVENKGQIELKYELINNEAQNQDREKKPGSFKGGLFGKMTAFTGKNMTAVAGKMTALKDLIGDAVETMEEKIENMTEKLELRDLADSAVQKMQTAAGAAVNKMEDFAQIASGAAGIFGLMDGPELQVPSMFGVTSKTGLSQNHREQNHRGSVIEIRIIQDKELIRTTDYDGKSFYWTFHGEPALVEKDSNLDVQYFQQGESQRQLGDYYLFVSEDRLMVYLVTRDTMRRFRGSADGTRRTPDKGSRIESANGSRKTPDKGSRTGNLANIPPICEGVAFFKSPSPIKTIEVKDLMFFAGCQSGKVIFCRLLHSDVDRCIPETGDFMLDLFEAPVLSRPNTSGELLHLRSYSHVTKYRPWKSRKSEITDETDMTRRSNFQMAAFDNDGEITSFLEGSNYNEDLIQWTGGISIPQYVQNNDGTISRPVTRSKLRPSTDLGNTNFSTLTYDPVENMPGPKFPLKQDLRLHTCTLCYFRDKLSAKDFREAEGKAESRQEGGLGPLTVVRNRVAKTKTESMLTPILSEDAQKMSTSQISLLLASMRAEMMSEKNRNFSGNARREHEAGMKQGDGEMTEDMSTNEPPINALRKRNFIEETKTKFLNFVEETRMGFQPKIPLSVQESPNRRRGSSFPAMHSRGSSQGSNSCNSTSKDSLLRNFSMAETVRLQVKSREGGGGSERARVGAGNSEGEGEGEGVKEKEKEREKLLALAVELNGLLNPGTRQARESEEK